MLDFFLHKNTASHFFELFLRIKHHTQTLLDGIHVISTENFPSKKSSVNFCCFVVEVFCIKKKLHFIKFKDVLVL
jgi:hypothetical protein